MSTNDVPGANDDNNDELDVGCWADHQDGSLLFVKGIENERVIYELYDVKVQPPISYQDAMREEAFKDQYSFPPTGKSKEKWTWHDKTPFPWERVMKLFDRPLPSIADVHDQLSATARVAQSLRLRAHKLQKEDIEQVSDRVEQKKASILSRIGKALAALKG